MEKFIYSDLHKSILHQLAMMKIGNSHSMESNTKWKILAVSTKSSNYKYKTEIVLTPLKFHTLTIH